MPSKSSQTHPNMLPFLHASSEIIQFQHKSNYICPLNKSTVNLSSLYKSYRIYWNRPDPPKQLEFIKNRTTPIKFTKPNSNIPKSIRIHSDLPNRWNRVKSAQINKKNRNPAEPMHINQTRRKSSIQPRPLKSTQTNRNPTRSSNYNEIRSTGPDPLTQSVSIIESLQTITDHTKRPAPDLGGVGGRGGSL